MEQRVVPVLSSNAVVTGTWYEIGSITCTLLIMSICFGFGSYHTQYGFLSVFAVSEGVLVCKKHEIFYLGRDSLYFQIFPWHFNFVRGHSLVELTEHDNSADDIMVHSICIYTAAFLAGTKQVAPVAQR